MTLIDRALMRAYQRRDQQQLAVATTRGSTEPDDVSQSHRPLAVSASEAAFSAEPTTAPMGLDTVPRRELYLHEPQVALRGFHHGFKPARGTQLPPLGDIEERTTSTAQADPAMTERAEAAPARTASFDDPLLSVSCFRFDVSTQAVPIVVNEPLTEAESKMSRPAAPGDRKLSDGTKEVTAPTVTPPPARQVFTPAWEVDRFRMTEACQNARMQLGIELDHAASALRETKNARNWDIPTIICIGSQSRGEGRTTIAILLASALARVGQRVLLMDGDVEQPNVALQLGMAGETGWHPGADSEAALADYCIRSLVDRFTVLPITEALDSPVMKAWDAVKRGALRLAPRFDVVLIDTAPGFLQADDFPGAELHFVVVRDIRCTSDESIRRLTAEGRLSATANVHIVDNFAGTPQACQFAQQDGSR
jgi:Mrp family chromosome partitioning ATPase